MLNLIRRFLCLCGMWASTTVCADSALQPSVVVSIPPLALLAQEIYGQQTQVDVLLRGANSAHHSVLRPSDIQRINQADTIYWVGPALENHLVKALHNKPSLALMSQLSHTGDDPHIWLNPDLAMEIAAIMAEKFIEGHPAQRAATQARLQALQGKLKQLDKTLQHTLLNTPPFVVFHNSLSHWVERYQLTQLASLSDVPEESIGLKTLAKVARLSKNAQCLLTEPGEAHTAQKYAQRLGLPMVAIDILATQQPHPSFTDFMLHTASSIRQCKK
ncbi:MAG: metal ABC transporter substrate-binding protein [Cellvibrionaceae bacterium]|nr:metal ABC transporter substrate-binding protein [Cellvibrionaceae bacterium]